MDAHGRIGNRGRILWVTGGTVRGRLRFLEKDCNIIIMERTKPSASDIEYGELLQRPARLRGEL